MDTSFLRDSRYLQLDPENQRKVFDQTMLGFASNDERFVSLPPETQKLILDDLWDQSDALAEAGSRRIEEPEQNAWDQNPVHMRDQEGPGIIRGAKNFTQAATGPGIDQMQLALSDMVKGDLPLEDSEYDKRQQAQMDEYFKSISEQKAMSPSTQAGVSTPLSVATSGIGMAAGLGASALAGGNIAVGSVAGGAVPAAIMYKIGKFDALRQIRDELKSKYTLTEEDWKNLQHNLDAEVSKAGLFEAGGEFVSDALGYAIFKVPVGKLGKPLAALIGQKTAQKIVGNTLGKLGLKAAGTVVSEVGGETATDVGRNQAMYEAEQKLPEGTKLTPKDFDPEDNVFERALKAVKDVGPATAIQTLAVGGARGIVDYAGNRLARGGKADPTDTAPPSVSEDATANPQVTDATTGPSPQPFVYDEIQSLSDAKKSLGTKSEYIENALNASPDKQYLLDNSEELKKFVSASSSEWTLKTRTLSAQIKAKEDELKIISPYGAIDVESVEVKDPIGEVKEPAVPIVLAETVDDAVEAFEKEVSKTPVKQVEPSKSEFPAGNIDEYIDKYGRAVSAPITDKSRLEVTPSQSQFPAGSKSRIFKTEKAAAESIKQRGIEGVAPKKVDGGYAIEAVAPVEAPKIVSEAETQPEAQTPPVESVSASAMAPEVVPEPVAQPEAEVTPERVFKTEKGAKASIRQRKLEGYEPVQVDGGFKVAKKAEQTGEQPKQKTHTDVMNEPVQVVTDETERQRIKNSIAEGELILRTGSLNGKKRSKEYLANVQRTVDRAKARLGVTEATDSAGTSEISGEKSDGGSVNRTLPPQKQPWEMTSKEFSDEPARYTTDTALSEAGKNLAGEITLRDGKKSETYYHEVAHNYINSSSANPDMLAQMEKAFLEEGDIVRGTRKTRDDIDEVATDVYGAIKRARSVGEKPMILNRPSGEWAKFVDLVDGEIGRHHKEIVSKAASEGKTIPKEVLDEYPDLSKPSGSQTQKSEPQTDSRVVDEPQSKTTEKKSYKPKIAGKYKIAGEGTVDDVIDSIDKARETLQPADNKEVVWEKPHSVEGEKEITVAYTDMEYKNDRHDIRIRGGSNGWRVERRVEKPETKYSRKWAPLTGGMSLQEAKEYGAAYLNGRVDDTIDEFLFVGSKGKSKYNIKASHYALDQFEKRVRKNIANTSRDKNKPLMYSTREGTKTDITEEQVQRAFGKAATVAKTSDTTFDITTPSGKVTLEVVDRIPIDEKAFEAAYGRKATPEEIERGASGVYQDGKIQISPVGDQWTITHEEVHWLMASGVLSFNDARAILRSAGVDGRNVTSENIGEYEEQIAAHIENVRMERAKPVGRAKEIIRKILDFVDGLVNMVGARTARGVIKDIESGDIYKQTETEAFKKWFGDSKVVDDDGNPLVVYHGTTASDFFEFSMSAAGANTIGEDAKLGMFFTSSKDVGNTYALPRSIVYNLNKDVQSEIDKLKEGWNKVDTGGIELEDFDIRDGSQVIDVYSDLAGDESEKEAARQAFLSAYGIDLGAMTIEEVDALSNSMQPDYSTFGVENSRVLPVYLSIKNPKIVDAKGYYDADFFSDEIKKAKKAGHDGLIFKNAIDGAAGVDVATTYVAFSPTQIKSAIGNSGTFDSTNPDIRYSTRVKAQRDFNNGIIDTIKDYGQVLLPAKLTKVGKQDLNRIRDLILRTPAFFAKKIHAAKAIFDASQKRVDRFWNLLNWMENSKINGVDVNTLTQLDEVKKLSEEGYNAVGKYLTDSDKNDTGFSIKIGEDDKWAVVNPKGATIQSFESRIEKGRDTGEDAAIEYMLDAEGEFLAGKGFTEDQRLAVRAFRMSTNKGFDLSLSNLKRVVALHEKSGTEMPKIKITGDDGKMKAITIRDAINLMGERRGKFFPRIRKPGTYILTATKEGQDKQLIKYSLLEGGIMNKKATELRREGWTVETSKEQRVGEDVFQLNGDLIKTQQILDAAIARVEKGDFSDETLEKEMLHMITTAVTEQVAEVVRERGARVHMNRRSKEYWAGYEMDPKIAISSYIRGMAAGEAKREMTGRMMKALTGTEVTWDRYQDIAQYDGDYASWMDENKDEVDADLVTEEMFDAINDPEWAETIGNATLDLEQMLKTETDKDMIATLKKDLSEKKQALYKRYNDFVKSQKIDNKEQPVAFEWAKAYIAENTRNQEAVDRIIGTLRGLAVGKFLAFRVVAAPLTNMTSLPTAGIATMKAAGIPYRKTYGLLTRGIIDYGNYRLGRLKGDKAKVFDYIHQNGWDNAQYNSEAMSTLRSAVGKKYDWIIEKGMWTFSESERLNRAATIAALYHGLEAKYGGTKSFEELMDMANDISKQAHGIYNKGDLPFLALGKHPAAHLARMFYVFKKYSHVYLQNMARMGLEEKDYGAVAHMLISPAILAGAGASVVMPIVSTILKAFGWDEPEEEMYRKIGSVWGDSTERFARFGAAGMAGPLGISLKGSLQMDIGDSLFGAPGSILKDPWDAMKYLSRGDVSKGIEKALPTGLASPFKATREYTEGLTTKSNAPLFYGEEQARPNLMEAFLRGMSLNPVGIATIREKQSKEYEVKEKYRNWSTDIYAKAKRMKLRGRMDQEKMAELLGEITKYNEGATRWGLSPITKKSIKKNLKRNFKASRFERERSERNN